MTTRFKLSLSLAIVSVLTADLFGQSSSHDTSLPTDAHSILSQAHGAWVENDAVVAGGAKYKARFDRRGMTFVPALGRRTRAMPFSFAVASFRRGDDTIRAAEQSDPKLESGYVATFSRGSGIQERFDVNADGVELSYLFPEKPPGSGDLVVRGRVTTQLEAPVGEHPDGMRFWKQNIGGDVTGIDADGREASGSLRWDGDHLDLVLPESFVDHASYPLLLDPVISSVFDINSSTTDYDDIRPDAAFDASEDCYLVVWQREYGIESSDIRAQRVDANGVLVGSFIDVNGGTGVDMRPTVCNINDVNTFVVAYQTATSAFGPFDIACATISANDGSVGGIASVAALSGNEVDPDASGERVASANTRSCIIVWDEQGQGIRAARVEVPTPNATPIPTPTVTISNGQLDEKPAISKSGGDVGRHCIVWQRPPSVTRAALVDRNLTILDSLYAVGSNAQDADVDGDGTNFMVAFERFETGLTGSRDIYCQRIRFDGVELVGVGNPAAIESNVNDDEFDPTVGFLGPKFVLLWSDGTPTFLRSVIAGRALSVDCEFCGDEFAFPASSYNIQPQVAARWAAGRANDEALIVYSSVSSTLGLDSDVLAVKFEAVGAGGSIVDAGGGCGSGGSASISGPWALATTASIDLTGTSGTLAALHIGLPGGFPCGTCQITSPFLAIPISLSGGNGSFSIALACTGYDLVGGRWEMQYASAFSGASPCPLAPSVSFSNRLVATFGL